MNSEVLGLGQVASGIDAQRRAGDIGWAEINSFWHDRQSQWFDDHYWTPFVAERKALEQAVDSLASELGRILGELP